MCIWVYVTLWAHIEARIIYPGTEVISILNNLMWVQEIELPEKQEVLLTIEQPLQALEAGIWKRHRHEKVERVNPQIISCSTIQKIHKLNGTKVSGFP